MDTEVKTRNAFLGTCPVCEGTFKVQKKHGSEVFTMVHHGFTRPGDGMNHGDCFAVGYEPYEKSCEATKLYLELVKSSLLLSKSFLSRLESGEVSYLTQGFGFGFIEFYHVGVTHPRVWEQVLQNRISQVKYEISEKTSEMVRLNHLIENWTLKEISVTVEMVEEQKKAERDARAAIRQAAKDAKNEKARLLSEKREKKEAERQEKLKSIADKFRAISDLPDKDEAKKQARDFWYELQRSKYKSAFKYGYSNNLKELGCDDILISLGLAKTHPGLSEGYFVYGP